MKKIYISLPITGHDIEEIKARCEHAAGILNKKGFIPVSPFDISPDTDASYSEHMGNDIRALLDCDGIIFLDGWERSKGCRLELAAAIIYSKDIINPNILK